MPRRIIYTRIWKRLIAAALGFLACLAGLMAAGYTYELADDSRNPAVSSWGTLIGTLVGAAIAIGGLIFAFRFLRFALSGRSEQVQGKIGAALLGLACFLPGFVFSLPVTLLCALHLSDNPASEMIAFWTSVGIGVLTAIVGGVLLFRKRRLSTSQWSAP